MALRIRLSAAGLHEDMLEYAASMVETMLEDSGTEVEDLVEILFPLFMDAESTTITDEAACRIFAEELMGKGSSSSGGGAAAGAASGAAAAPVAAVPPAERIAAALIAACPALEATMVEYVSSLAAGPPLSLSPSLPLRRRTVHGEHSGAGARAAEACETRWW